MRMCLCANGEFIEKKGTLLEKENLRIKKNIKFCVRKNTDIKAWTNMDTGLSVLKKFVYAMGRVQGRASFFSFLFFFSIQAVSRFDDSTTGPT